MAAPQTKRQRPPPAVLEIADTSRAAALAFLRGTSLGWSADDLAAWVAGPYREATAGAARFARKTAAATPLDPQEGSTLERVLLSTRERLLEILSTHHGWRELGFAARAVAAGLVIPVRDSAGTVGYAPVEQPRVTLFDRLASLFLADYLTRPRDYDELCVCDECGEVFFSWAPSHHRSCETPPSKSEIVPRQGYSRDSAERGYAVR